MVTNSSINLATAASGKLVQAQGIGVANGFTTATYPSTAGTSGNVLTSDGTNWNSTSSSGVGALVFLQSQTATNSASLAFSSTFITSAYNSYAILLTNYVPANSATNLEMQWSVDNGSSYVTTGYSSGTQQIGFSSAAITNANVSTYNIMLWQTANTLIGEGWIYLYSLQDGNPATTNAYMAYNGNSIILAMGFNSTTSVNNIKFLSTSVNITSGKFTLFGVKES